MNWQYLIFGLNILILVAALTSLNFLQRHPKDDFSGYVEAYNTQLKESSLIDMTLLPRAEVIGLEKPPHNKNLHGCGPVFACHTITDCNCSSLCGHEYTNMLVLPSDKISIHGSYLKPGSYCVKETPKCHRNLSEIIMSDVGWACVCKFPEFFSGDSCSKQVACLHDGRAGTIVDSKNDSVPVDITKYHDFYEKNDDGSLRYICKKQKDEFGNWMVSPPYLPIYLFVDPCFDNIPFSSVPGMNWEKGICDCGDFTSTRQRNKILKDSKSPCTSCFTEYSEDKREMTFRFACLSSRDPKTGYENTYPCSDLNPPVPCCETKLRLNTADSAKNASYTEYKSY